jgi:hypothetical protein
MLSPAWAGAAAAAFHAGRLAVIARSRNTFGIEQLACEGEIEQRIGKSEDDSVRVID